MTQDRCEFLKSELIKQELESTPWEALVKLAERKVLLELLAIPREELELRCVDALGKFEDVQKSSEDLANFIIVSSTTVSVLEQARVALAKEYQQIPLEDLETLYGLFSGGVKSEGYQDDIDDFLSKLEKDS